MTIQMKKKPIKQGFKFNTLCDTTTGFILYCVPDSLQEKKMIIIDEKVISIARIFSGHGERKYVIVMVNYFMHSKTMKGSRHLNVDTFRTTRGK